MGILLTAEQGSMAGSLISMVLMYAIIIGAMYFIFLRPQKKEQKRLQAMIAAVEVGIRNIKFVFDENERLCGLHSLLS